MCVLVLVQLSEWEGRQSEQAWRRRKDSSREKKKTPSIPFLPAAGGRDPLSDLKRSDLSKQQPVRPTLPPALKEGKTFQKVISERSTRNSKSIDSPPSSFGLS